MLIVEPPSGGEVAALLGLAARNLAPAMDGDDLVAALEHGLCLVARETTSSGVLGFALANRDAACEAHLIALAVESAYRGAGIGSALLRRAEEVMARSGARRMTLEVRADHIAAQRFYARQGFAPEGLQTQAYADGADAVFFARPLN
jgi:ribosomal protein S18 acetylase RimI-like enzyme